MSVVKLFRYVRPTEIDLNRVEVITKPTGGITFLFVIDQDAGMLSYSPVICRDDENFNYKISANIAEGRYSQGMLYRCEYDRSITLVQNVIEHMNKIQDLSNRLQTLKNKLKIIIAENKINIDLHTNIVNQVNLKHSSINGIYTR